MNDSDQSLERFCSDAASYCSDKREAYFKPQELDSTSKSKIVRTGSNVSDLSRIISGVRDDQQLGPVSLRDDPDQILREQLDCVTRQSTKADVEEKLEDLSPPPDGGFGWVVAVCAMFSVFATWGSNSGYGVFLNFYLTTDKFPGATEYDFALIGGLVVCLAQGLAPFAIIACNVFGFKNVCYFGIVLQTAGYLLASFSTTIWQLYLTQGVLVGISFSLIFIPSTLILPTWFDKRLATSMGICVSGSGLGGLVFSLSVNKVIEMTGDQRWALRMCCFITLVVALSATLIMKPRNEKPIQFSKTLSSKFIKENFSLIFDIKVFKMWPLVGLAWWFALCLSGYTLLLFSMSSYASLVGLSHNQAATVTSVMNAAQTVGRPIMGMIADKIGRNNMGTGLTLTISILIFAFWINATTYGAILGFAVLMGLIVGVGSSLVQSLAAVILRDSLEKLPAAWSGINIFVSFFCLVAEVIALALRQEQSARPYLHTQIFSGVCFFVAFLQGLVMREWVIRRELNDRLEKSTVALARLERAANGYLTAAELNAGEEPKIEAEDVPESDTADVLRARVNRYRFLTRPLPTMYVIRAFYPIVA